MTRKINVSDVENSSQTLKKQFEYDQYLRVLALKETPVAVGIVQGENFITTFANPLFCVISGTKHKNIMNKPLFQAIPEVSGQGFEGVLEGVLKTGIPFIGSESPVTLKRHGKLETGYFSFVFNPIRNDQGENTAVMIIATEVTGKVLKEKTIQEEREHLYEIFMYAPAAISVLRGPNHIIDLVNPLAQKALGIKRQLVGKPIKEALPEIQGQGFIEILNTVYKTGKPFIGNEVQTLFDREENGNLVEGYYNFVYQPDVDEHGKVIGIFVYAVDVTEQVTSRKIIEESEKRMANILESISDGFISFDKEWRYIYVNKEACKIIGKKNEEIVGKNVTELFPEFFTTDAGKQLLIAAKTGKNIFFQTYYPTLNKWFDARIYPGKDGVTTSFRDVTQGKLLEKQKEEFLGIASHELKTPVTSLKAFAQVLQDRFSRIGDMKSANLLKKMNSQINKLTSLIQDLLDVSKVESGKLSLHKETFYIDRLIEEIAEEIQRTTDANIIITKDKSHKIIFADRERIGQVLTNFLTNAVKYSPPKSKIIISSKIDNKRVTICVRDFGIGISKENLKNIFNRFFRVSENKFNTVPGMGLGLNIALEIINRHKGKIWVKSKLNEGSEFCFSIPLNLEER